MSNFLQMKLETRSTIIRGAESMARKPERSWAKVQSCWLSNVFIAASLRYTSSLYSKPTDSFFI